MTSAGEAIRALDVPFTGLMQQFMVTNGIRAGQLAIAKDGAVKYDIAHMWTETGSGYRQPLPSDCFRLASCSKIFTAAAVQSLVQAGGLALDTKVYPLLGLSNPADPRSDTITIRQLLEHRAGYDRDASGFDPSYRMVDIAKALGLNRAVTKQDVIQYMYAHPLDYAPDSLPANQYKYSNYGYLLLGAAVERVTGQKLIDYVRETLLGASGLEKAEVQVATTDKAAQAQNEPLYEDGGIGADALHPASGALASNPYGGEGQIYEVTDAAGGLAASARALVKFIHFNAVWGYGPRDPNTMLARKGSTAGTLSYACSRPDGVDWVFIFNSRDWPTDWDKTSDDFAKSINALLDKTAIPYALARMPPPGI